MEQGSNPGILDSETAPSLLRLVARLGAVLGVKFPAKTHPGRLYNRDFCWLLDGSRKALPAFSPQYSFWQVYRWPFPLLETL